MLSRLGLAISRVFQRCAPDPFVLAVLLTLLTAVIALTAGTFDTESEGLGARAVALLDAWRGDAGMWKFLRFAMQMCLILVTGYALAESRPVRRVIDALVDVPRNTSQAASMVAFFAIAAGLINWGLGLIVGALMARDTGRSLRRRGIPAHYPLICAAGYTGLLAWHGGLSGSAPLKSTTLTELTDTFGEGAIAQLGLTEGIELSRTIASPMNLVISGVLLVGVPVLLLLLAPRTVEEMRTIDEFDVPRPPEAPTEPAADQTIPDRLYDSRTLAWLLALPLLAGLARYAAVNGLGRLGPNEINAAMLGLGLLLQGSLRSYATTAQEGARACAGIMLQFPLYAGILGMLSASGLIRSTAAWFTEIGDASTVPLLTFASAGIVNLFVPSGGGQWGIQGLVALEAGQAAGVAPGKMIMAVAYGDQLTNMLQPFWALPLLGITGVRARDIVGYTAIVMVAAGLWMAAGLLLF